MRVYVTITLLAGLLVCAAQHIPPLPKGLKINRSTVTVSGVSSGGAMATQLHVSYSQLIHGIAMYAAPPFYCANNDALLALSACMKEPWLISTTELTAITEATALTGFIDAPINMANSYVWLYSGTNDTIVHPGVVQKTYDYYASFMDKSRIKTEFKVHSEHAWVNDDPTMSPCNYLGSPFINNCGRDLVGEFLSHILFTPNNITLNKRTAAVNGSLIEFNQTYYLPAIVEPIIDPQTVGLAHWGMVYIPKVCYTQECHLHIAIHGCESNSEWTGNDFFTKLGLNEYAETNNMIILYPQAHSIPEPINPYSCWDWWGYTGPSYASNVGLQTRTIHNMIWALMNAN